MSCETILNRLPKLKDTLVDDFLMTYIVFFPLNKMIVVLISYYKMFDNEKNFLVDHSINNKKKVVEFVRLWCDTAKDSFLEDLAIISFLQELLEMLKHDIKLHPVLKSDLKFVELILESYTIELVLPAFYINFFSLLKCLEYIFISLIP